MHLNAHINMKSNFAIYATDVLLNRHGEEKTPRWFKIAFWTIANRSTRLLRVREESHDASPAGEGRECRGPAPEPQEQVRRAAGTGSDLSADRL